MNVPDVIVERFMENWGYYIYEKLRDSVRRGKKHLDGWKISNEVKRCIINNEQHNAVDEFVGEISDHLNGKQFPLKIYRELGVEEGKFDSVLLAEDKNLLIATILTFLNRDSVGRYWSFSSKGAQAFRGRSSFRFKISAVIDKDQVDWKETLQYQCFEARDPVIKSDEVRLVEGKDIDIVGITFQDVEYPCPVPKICKGKV
jgi:hypothetical protein